MFEKIIYQKPAFRRPIRRGGIYVQCDMQGAIPLAWCDICGAEVFQKNAQLCARCKKGGRRYA